MTEEPSTRVATSFAKQGLMAHLGARLGDVSPGELEAIGTVLKSGRTLTVCRMDVFAHSGGERKLVAAGQQTVIAVRV